MEDINYEIDSEGKLKYDNERKYKLKMMIEKKEKELSSAVKQNEK